MESKPDQLLHVIEEAAALMRSVGEDHWAGWLEKDARWIRASDFYGVQHFYSAFGGMGSITDLVIHPLNKHRVAESEISAVNDRLQYLLGRGYELAQEVRREEAGG
ncbi:DUF6966 domain-containing protein [Solimonas terrae]|uniref:DUF6966 domain-containing protein n=1 Tax=Solimonas terrae TaxID=1396819 RepID=A0A6M2BRL2_9GAMM|nr:hypothetical protein [Solimonas terrae]NGY04733.1 hypothetical protein [Solimonas terrae]